MVLGFLVCEVFVVVLVIVNFGWSKLGGFGVEKSLVVMVLNGFVVSDDCCQIFVRFLYRWVVFEQCIFMSFNFFFFVWCDVMVFEEYGCECCDLYFWFCECEVLEVREYLEVENCYFEEYIVDCVGLVEEIYGELKECIVFDDSFVFVVEGSFEYFVCFVEGDLFVSYWWMFLVGGDSEKIFDVNEFVEGCFFVQVGSVVVSFCGQCIVYIFDDCGWCLYLF